MKGRRVNDSSVEAPTVSVAKLVVVWKVLVRVVRKVVVREKAVWVGGLVVMMMKDWKTETVVKNVRKILDTSISVVLKYSTCVEVTAPKLVVLLTMVKLLVCVTKS